MLNSNCKLYEPNTLLLAMYGQGITRGKVAILKTEATVNQAIAAILVGDEAECKFLFNELKCMYSFIRDLAVGGNQHNLNMNIVARIPIVKVEKEQQQAFVAIANHADKSEFELRKSIEAIDQVIKSLINN